MTTEMQVNNCTGEQVVIVSKAKNSNPGKA